MNFKTIINNWHKKVYGNIFFQKAVAVFVVNVACNFLKHFIISSFMTIRHIFEIIKKLTISVVQKRIQKIFTVWKFKFFKNFLTTIIRLFNCIYIFISIACCWRTVNPVINNIFINTFQPFCQEKCLYVKLWILYKSCVWVFYLIFDKKLSFINIKGKSVCTKQNRFCF